MRRMKDSGLLGIGDIPADWEVIKTKFVLSYVKRPPQNHSEVVTCFRDGTVTLRSNKREEGFTFSDKEIGYQQIHVGDFVFHGMDGFAGSIGVSDSFGKASPVLIVCEQNKKSSNKYYCYYFRNLANNNVFEDAGNGVRIRSCDIRWNKLGNMYIIVPPLLSQHRIAAYLDAKCAEIDRSMELVRQSMDKLKAYKMSVITEAVTKGLAPDVPMKDSGVPWIGEMPERWEIQKIKFFSLIKNGDAIRSEELLEDGLFEAFGGNGKIGNCNKYNCDGNVFIVGRVGALCGNIRKSNKKIFISDNALILKIIQNDFDFIYFSLVAANLGSLSTSNAQPLITATKINNVYIALPPLSDQHRIAAYLDAKCAELDAIIAQKQELLDKLAAYRKSLIFECVTGKREVAA